MFYYGIQIFFGERGKPLIGMITTIWLYNAYIKKIDKKILLNLLYLILLLVVTFSGYGLWKAYCSKNGVHVDFQHDANNIETLNIKDYLKSITYVKAPTGKLKDITTTFYIALNDDGNGVIANGIVRSAIGLLVIFLIINALC